MYKEKKMRNEWKTMEFNRVYDYDYGYMPASPYADFWREHDERQAALRTRRHKRYDDIVWAITMTADSEEEYRQFIKEIYT
mgnify:CR=1 FL=1|tara:strand:+ start:88 stop:330 length:243 start_codon:yes stop_codon:yes gene_type:complete